jgi:hypothetical protein
MSFQSETEKDFSRARFKAFLRELIATVARRPNELLSFDQVKRSLKIFGQNYRGIQTVPVAHIVGSATLRYHDFDRAFMPTQSTTKSRWQRVDEAYYEAVELPPVQLYQVGEVFFVRDGHHRVSVARERGQEFIEAEVIEVKTRVPLTPDLTARDLEIAGEYADFLDKTRLDKSHPDAAIQFSEPGGYARLIEHIAVHRYFLGAEQNQKIAWRDAVASWFDNVYCPAIQVIREHTILNDFPQRTEADVYLWIMDHHYFLNQNGDEVNLEQAAMDFAEQYSERVDKKIFRAMRQAVTEFLEGNELQPLEGTMASEPHHTNPESNNEK